MFRAELDRRMCMLFINYYDVKGKGFMRGINRSYKGFLMAVNVRMTYGIRYGL